MLEGEPSPAAPHAGLHLVEHEQPAVGIAEPAQPRQIVRGRHAHAAFALDRFDEHGTDVLAIARQRLDGFQVVERHAHETRQQRLEAGLHATVAGGGERGEGPAVEAVLHHHDDRVAIALAMGVGPRELDGGLVGLGTAVAEEGAFHAAVGAERLGQPFLERDLVEVRAVDELFRLPAEGLGHVRMGVAEIADCDTRERIQISPALCVPEPGAAAVREMHGQTGIGLHEMCRHDVRLPGLCPENQNGSRRAAAEARSEF